MDAKTQADIIAAAIQCNGTVKQILKAIEDADMELRSIYAGSWTVELAEIQRERVY